MQRLKKLTLPILALLIIAAAFLRFKNLEGKTTFEWDQARDIDRISEIVYDHDLKFLGPVVRGQGGFHLGPLYYYLAAPGLAIMGGDPIGLSVTSVLIDLAVVAGIFFFIKKVFSFWPAIIASGLWSFSWLIINESHTPWNVSLLQPWVLLTFITLYQLEKSKKFSWLLLLTFLSALSLHIHFSLVPVSGFLLLMNWRQFSKLDVIQWLKLLLAAALPVLPLALFDLTHSFLNSKLFLGFLKGTAAKTYSLSFVIETLLEKLGYTISRFLIGAKNVPLGLSVLGFSLLYGFFKRKDTLIKYSLVVTLLIIFSLLIYRDPDFAEYYIYPVFIPLIIIFSHLLNNLLKGQIALLALTVSLALISSLYYFNLQNYNFQSDPYSLAVKKDVVQQIASYGNEVILHTDLPPGRGDGFDYLLRQSGVSKVEDSQYLLILTESDKTPAFVDRTERLGEEYFGGFKLTVNKLQK